jgi:hypothetical protein
MKNMENVVKNELIETAIKCIKSIDENDKVVITINNNEWSVLNTMIYTVHNILCDEDKVPEKYMDMLNDIYTKVNNAS